MLRRFMSSRRVRAARRALAKDTSPANYARLAQEYGVLGKLDQARAVAAEGLQEFPSSRELREMHERSLRHLREGRARDLVRELRSAPRAAVYRELCDIYLESGELERADSLAKAWFSSLDDSEAIFYRGAVWTRRFFTDRRRSDARKALDLLRQANEAKPRDERPLRTELQILSRCGAWRDARQVIVRLLELNPGDPILEARFRRIIADGAGAPTLEQALKSVEKTGILIDEEGESVETHSTTAIRPILQSLVTDDGARMAMYVQGGTALIQGPKGATAERAARSMREMAKSSQAAARKIGLGIVSEVRVAGDFGELVIQPGSLGVGAIWSDSKVTKRQTDGLRRLAGAQRKEGSS